MKMRLTGPRQVADERHYCAFTDLLALEDGTVLLAYNAGAGHEAGDVAIHLRRSRDGGRIWDAPIAVQPAPSGGGLGARDPHLALLPGGRIVLSWFDYPTRDLADLRVRLRWSNDGGLSWGDASTIPVPLPCAATSGKMVHGASGTLLLPVYGLRSLDRRVFEAGVVCSEDGGSTWSAYRPIGIIDEVDTGGYHGCSEMEVAETAPGRWMAVIRRDRHPALVYRSDDDAITWSRVADLPWIAHAPALLAVADRIFLVVRKVDGTASPTDSGVTWVTVTRDEGKTWDGGVEVGRRAPSWKDVGYGGIAPVGKGVYLVSWYEAVGDGGARIMVAEMDAV